MVAAIVLPAIWIGALTVAKIRRRKFNWKAIGIATLSVFLVFLTAEIILLKRLQAIYEDDVMTALGERPCYSYQHNFPAYGVDPELEFEKYKEEKAKREEQDKQNGVPAGTGARPEQEH